MCQNVVQSAMKLPSLGLTTPSPAGSSPGSPTSACSRAGPCSPGPFNHRESRHERHQIKSLTEAPINVQGTRRFRKRTPGRKDRDDIIAPLLDQFIVFIATAKRVGSFPSEGLLAAIL